jgi:predicted acyl esterase
MVLSSFGQTDNRNLSLLHQWHLTKMGGQKHLLKPERKHSIQTVHLFVRDDEPVESATDWPNTKDPESDMYIQPNHMLLGRIRPEVPQVPFTESKNPMWIELVLDIFQTFWKRCIGTQKEVGS